MCTLIALVRCVPGSTLVAAANRDEFLDRPAEPPALRVGTRGAIVAPLDRRAGGTWLGVNGAGLFAGITNRPTATPDPTRRSRGLLVKDVLGAASAREALERLECLEAGVYNPFQLFVADAQEAGVVVYDERPRRIELGPGAHVIGNTDPDDRSVAKVRRILERAEQVAAGDPGAVMEGLTVLLRSHEPDPDPLASPCIHAGDYGTRSSTLLWLGPDRVELAHADGPPCRTPYRDFTPLLHELFGAVELGAGEPAARRAS